MQFNILNLKVFYGAILGVSLVSAPVGAMRHAVDPEPHASSSARLPVSGTVDERAAAAAAAAPSDISTADEATSDDDSNCGEDEFEGRRGTGPWIGGDEDEWYSEDESWGSSARAGTRIERLTAHVQELEGLQSRLSLQTQNLEVCEQELATIVAPTGPVMKAFKAAAWYPQQLLRVQQHAEHPVNEEDVFKNFLRAMEKADVLTGFLETLACAKHLQQALSQLDFKAVPGMSPSASVLFQTNLNHALQLAEAVRETIDLDKIRELTRTRGQLCQELDEMTGGMEAMAWGEKLALELTTCQASLESWVLEREMRVNREMRDFRAGRGIFSILSI